MLPPGGEDNQGGGTGGQPVHGWLAPRGATCPGGKINWDTGSAEKCGDILSMFWAFHSHCFKENVKQRTETGPKITKCFNYSSF